MIFLFWNRAGEYPYILGDDGEFYFYSEDSVEISHGLDGRHWTKLNKMQDMTPLNELDKYDFYSEKSNDWIMWENATKKEVALVHIHAKDPDWRDRL